MSKLFFTLVGKSRKEQFGELLDPGLYADPLGRARRIPIRGRRDRQIVRAVHRVLHRPKIKSTVENLKKNLEIFEGQQYCPGTGLLSPGTGIRGTLLLSPPEAIARL